MDVVQIVKNRFDITLKPEQRTAITAFLSGKDVFVCLPTGYGKLLCYGSLPAIYDALYDKDHGHSIVVVLPLESLMKDQAQGFSKLGIKAGYVRGPASRESIVQGEYDVIFISPESLLTNRKWREMIKNDVYRKKLIAFIVDEAHCVKTW